ncbi:MAG TPA: ABC transporter permease [Bacteroidales bacterium]|nr:ABC transporter permease [Bacteroidales bacterium]
MLNNLIKYSLRSFTRQRSYILINITGLSIGIACSLLIALYIFNEVSYDRYNVKRDRVFNVVLNFRIGGQESNGASSPAPLGAAMLSEFPEVEDFLRMKLKYDANPITYNNETYSEEYIMEADSSFFNFFSIPVLRGDPKNLLNARGKVVLSASLAEKIFGEQDPVDKVLKLGKDTSVYVVTGVMGDIPGNTHFKAEALVSMMSDPQSYSQHWGNNNMNTYLLLKPNADYTSLNEKLKQLVVSHIGPLFQEVLSLSFEEFLNKGNKHAYYLQKLTDIHLDTSVEPHFLAPGDPKLLKILSGIALLILLVAAVNFTNLSTAQASARSKEVAIKKLGGSTRGMLVSQFLTESVIMSFASTIIALVIIKIVLPFFNDLLDTTLTLRLSDTWYLIPFIIIFSLLTGILAGSYPAFFLSSFSPYRVLKGAKEQNSHKGSLRKMLVVLQFTISIFLIIGTFIMYRQITYMLERDPGFNNDLLLVIENEGALGAKAIAFKETIAMIPGVVNVTSSTSVPGKNSNNQGYALEGKRDETILMWTYFVDYNFLQTYGMKLQSGRFFNKEFPSDAQACLVNESAIKKFNIDPGKMRILGYRDSGKTDYYPIIGVVNDFIFESQKNQIAPFMFRLRPESQRYGNITVKISPQNYRETIGKVGDNWKKFTTDEPIKYRFVDDIMKQLYISDRQNALIAVISSVLAIFIAALGLYGLTSYTVEHRTKEIGVRKAMGSSVLSICIRMSWEIIILIAISALISFPLIYYFSGKWLENFFYRISPGIFIYSAGLLFALVIALLTISYQTLKAARANPARSLQYE